MRDVEFKVWNKVFKKFYELKAIYFDGDMVGIKMGDEVDGEWTVVKREHVELVQYTGLKDKNGKEIFEGDILEFCHEANPEDTKERSVITWFGDSEWNYPAFDLDASKFKDHHFEGNALSEIVSTGYYHYRIIGNIHENPELLEVAGK